MTTGPTLLCEKLERSDPACHEDLQSTVREAVSQAERTRIVDALMKTGGNRVKTAKLLKISRASLYNKLRTYSIE
jgi:DNA-binding NtrC family response regulator